MYTVIKRMEVSAAHSLKLSYQSKCENLHGHNWIITVYCRAKELNADGMVVDFSHIKQAVKEKLDPRNINEVLPFNPTAENMARWICSQIPTCFKVEVQESESNVATYEKEYNGGMGSNGLTSARHDVFAKYLAEKYPESYDKAVPDELVYSGKLKLTDSVEGSPLDAGKLVLSPTRTYAPVVKKLLDALRPEIHGMVHCSGGAQTKVLHFVGDNCRVVKDNLFPVPPLFRTIKEQSDTDWSEMYKVFNMGHRLEVYLSPEHAEEVIAISKSFNIDAQIVGRIEESDKKELIIKSEFGEFRY